MKYIMFEEPSGIRWPLMFPEIVQHSDIARAINSETPGIKPVSAGFFSMLKTEGENVYLTHGKSVSMGLDAKAEDAEEIKKTFDFSC